MNTKLLSQERKTVFPQQTLFPQSFDQRKSIFLRRLASPSGKIKYKRYIGSPLRYAGGKSLAVGLIVKLIPDDTKRIISPFLGGGSVEVACAVELNLPVVAYDIFYELINYWKMQLQNPKLLFELLSQLAPRL